MIVAGCLAFAIYNIRIGILKPQFSQPCAEFDYRKPLNIANVEQVFTLIRPSLQNDGGDLKLISIEDSTVEIELTGNCANCPMKNQTLKNGIEANLNKYIRSDVPIKVILKNNKLP